MRASILRLLTAAALVSSAAALTAADAPKRVGVAKCVSESASILRREQPAAKWQLVAQNEELFSGDQLLLIGSDVGLTSKNGAVRLNALGEMTGVSPFPVLDTSIVLNVPSGDLDLDFVLQRGRVDVANLKEKGAAKVRIHTRDKYADFVLSEPGARLAVEVYGRWPKGVPFKKDAKPADGPALAVVVLALKGAIEMECPGKLCHHLHAPPGPALVIGDSVADADRTLQRLEKLPDWADGAVSDEEKQRKAMAAKFRQLATTKGEAFTVAEFLHSKEPHERQAAIYMLAATDNLELLTAVLARVEHPDMWDSAVTALRHWIGREPGQDQKLYDRLVNTLKFPPAQAALVLNLLHSFGDEEVARPELYETLIDYLEHERPGIRGLAHWHLIRLAPAGRPIGFSPNASKEERAKAVAAWRKLIPAGKMPPKVAASK